MYESDSMAEFDTEVIIKFCERYIKYREDYIEKERQKYINGEMQPKSYFFGLITVKGQTKEEAEKSWDHSDDITSPKAAAELYCYSEYKKVLSLWTLAKNTSRSTIYVPQSMAFIFFF